MSITKTIGGDRLGSGKKMKQSMHNYERSTHDIGYPWQSTMASGTLVPFLSMPSTPGDTYDIKLRTKVMTHPTVGPCFGTFKLQLDLFLADIRLYQAQLHNNKTNIGLDMSKIKLPLIDITDAPSLDWSEAHEPIDLQQVGSSSLLRYLGISGVGDNEVPGGTVKGEFNAIPLIAYWDIFKNYYANKQEENAYYIGFTEVATNNRLWTAKHYGIASTPVTDMPSSGGLQLAAGQRIEFRLQGGQEIDEPDSSEDFYQDFALNVDTVPSNDPEGLINIRSLYESSGNQLISAVVAEEPGSNGKIIGFNVIITNLITDNWPNGVTSLKIFDAGKIDEIFEEAGEENIELGAELNSFPLENLDKMREDILGAIGNPEPFMIDKNTYAPYGYLFGTTAITQGGATIQKMNAYGPMSGLAVKTYQSDLFNNWIKTEFIDGENGIGAVSAATIDLVTDTTTETGLRATLSMDTLLLSKKVYNMLNRIAISGGTYYDWIEVTYGQDPAGVAETPIYVGGASQEIVFGEVISQSATEAEPLGSLAGKGYGANNKGGNIIVKNPREAAYLIGIVSITPRLVYSQGNSWDMNLKTLDDLHKPEFDGIAYQDLITEQMAAWDVKRDASGVPTYKSAGKTVAWINYMTNYGKSFGLFADVRNEMFMTLNRRYEKDEDNRTIKDLTTYVDPSKYNYAFASTELAAQNFWVQIDVDITVRRKISAKQIPNL